MEIGIGITTFNRPEHLELWLRQIKKHTNCEYKLHIAKDIPNIAKAKNECLYNLRDCDHIFLFDDDCFPINDGWVDFIIKGNNPGHLLYLTARHNYYSGIEDVCLYRDCSGVFMYIRNDVFKSVGYFNEGYKQYGFEHAGYSNRACKNELGTLYPSKINTELYIYSIDYSGEGNWGIKHKPSVTDYKALMESLAYNKQVYLKEINSPQIYYPYENTI